MVTKFAPRAGSATLALQVPADTCVKLADMLRHIDGDSSHPYSEDVTFHTTRLISRANLAIPQLLKCSPSQWTILGSEYVTKASCAKTWKGRLDHVKTVTFRRRQRRFEIVCKAFAQIDENQ